MIINAVCEMLAELNFKRWYGENLLPVIAFVTPYHFVHIKLSANIDEKAFVL